MHALPDRLVIVGTSHVARQSKKDISAAFESFKPDVVAIELDRQRLGAMLSKESQSPNPFSLVRQVGLTGTIFVLIGRWAQQRFGNIVQTEPGADMKSAFLLAKEHKKQVLLVDQPLTTTLRNMKRWSWRERMKILWDLLTSPFRKEVKVRFDLQKVPSGRLVDTLLDHFKGRYPELHKILVGDRDRFIARAIKQYQTRFPDKKVLLVVGAGHVGGITHHLT